MYLSLEENMENAPAPYYFDDDSPIFEENSHQNGMLYWYASQMMTMLGYTEYSPTMKPIQKAIQVCMGTNIDTTDNFREEWREVDGKKFKDFKLSRFACYLIAMNSDIKKPQVAKAQTYFAAITSAVQEIIRDHEDIERVTLRSDITDHEKSLSSTAHKAGLTNFAYFQNQGYMGLYNMPLSKIKHLKGIPESRTPLDFMGSEELGANIFRITQTEAKIKREKINGQHKLEQAARDVGGEVRSAIKKMGGAMPEELATRDDILKIKSGLKKTNKEFAKMDKPKIEKPKK